MKPDTPLPRDYEECRLVASYEASRAKEHAAASQLLYPRHRLPHPAYMKLVDDLRTVRKDCNEKMLAVRAHKNKMLDPLVCRILPKKYVKGRQADFAAVVKGSAD
jgi:hypothetical protein